MLYDVLFYFINILVDEIIKILVEKVFNDNWFNKVCGFSIIKIDFIELLEVVVKN